jgi:hypothetical protein
VNVAALVVLLSVLGLAAAALWHSRDAVRRRWPELACYAAMLVAVVLAVSWVGYRNSLTSVEDYVQARYLLPLLPLYAGLVALAARGAGPRRGPMVGAGLITLLMAQSLFALMLTVGRYYG